MGLLSFFGFGADSAHNAHIAAEAAKRARNSLDIDVCIAAHENWLTRLETYLVGRGSARLDPEKVASDSNCDLGRWIHGDGEKYLGEYAAFQDLKAIHQMFHYKASSVVSLYNAEKVMEAQQELSGDVTRLSHKIITRLEDLKNIE
ncbi:MAG: hypothetical protein CMI09_11465 [Oceanospirillaceae bacterium]|nr:hypothetical protein [Oceanospirillaceae bacterium]